MATTGPIIMNLRTNTRLAKPVLLALCPLVWLGLMEWRRAAAIAGRFVRVKAHVEGWGGD